MAIPDKTELMDLATASAIATPTIAVLVAIITWRQWVTNRARLRHELFDRRYEVYETVSAFVASVVGVGVINRGASEEFLRQTKKAYFVFGGDLAIRDFVQDIYQHAVELETLQAKQNGLAGEMLASNVDKQSQVKRWFVDTLGSLASKFTAYLHLAH